MKARTPEEIASVLDLRRRGKTRQEISITTNIPIGGVKSVLLKAGLSLPMEERQRLAYRAKLAKNPNAMESMRSARTEESLAKQREGIKLAWANTELRKRASEARRGIPNPLMATHTFAEVFEACAKLGFAFIEPRPAPTDLLFNTANRDDQWSIRCHCGSVFHPGLHDIVTRRSKSCGCVRSHAESDLRHWVIENLDATTDQAENHKLIPPFCLDITVPSRRIAIEYNGLYWHGERLSGVSARRAAKKKYELVEALGWRLVTIFEDEWVFRRPQVEAYLRAIFNARTLSVGGRDTVVAIVPGPEARSFLESVHIQGAPRGDTYSYLGLSSAADGLLAVAAFRALDEGRWELSRYAQRSGVRVHGGLLKFIAELKRQRPECRSIVTFSDNRWSQGALYAKSGFVLEADLAPSYWYSKKNTQGPREHKFGFRKAKLAKQLGWEDDHGLTEWAMACELGYDRVWDCGGKRWALQLP